MSSGTRIGRPDCDPAIVTCKYARGGLKQGSNEWLRGQAARVIDGARGNPAGALGFATFLATTLAAGCPE
jgi:hypothetical protein